MNLYCIKFLNLTHNDGVKIEHEIEGKVNLFSYCIDYIFL